MGNQRINRALFLQRMKSGEPRLILQDQSSHDHRWKIILKRIICIKELSQQDQSNDYPSENQSDAGRSAKATEELKKDYNK